MAVLPIEGLATRTHRPWTVTLPVQQRPLPDPALEPGLPGLLAGLDGDQDLRVGPAPVLLRWRDGHVASAEPAFDAVARLLAGGAQPDSVAAALAGRPAGLDGIALLAWLAGEAGAGLAAAAAELTTQAAADLLAAGPASGQAEPPGPVQLDLGIGRPELLGLAAARLAAQAALERVNGPGAVPRLTGATLPAPGEAGHLSAALVARIDGRRSVADLAAACGHTTFEVATALSALAAAGAITVAPSPTAWPGPPPAHPGEAHAALTAFQWEAGGEPGEPGGPGEPGDAAAPVERADVGAAWLELRGVLAGDAPEPEPEPEPEAQPEPEPEPEPEPVAEPVRVAGDVDSSALLRELASFNLGEDEQDEERPVPPVRAPAGGGATEDKGKGGRFGFRRGGRR